MFDLRNNGIEQRRRDVAFEMEDAFCRNCVVTTTSVKTATAKRTWTRCRWRLHERPTTRSLVQQLARDNIHHGSTADKTRVSSNNFDHSRTRWIAPTTSATSSCIPGIWLQCTTSSRLKIAHRATAARPMEYLEGRNIFGDDKCQLVESRPKDKDNEQLWRRAQMDHNSNRD